MPSHIPSSICSPSIGLRKDMRSAHCGPLSAIPTFDNATFLRYDGTGTCMSITETAVSPMSKLSKRQTWSPSSKASEVPTCQSRPLALSDSRVAQSADSKCGPLYTRPSSAHTRLHSREGRHTPARHHHSIPTELISRSFAIKRTHVSNTSRIRAPFPTFPSSDLPIVSKGPRDRGGGWTLMLPRLRPDASGLEQDLDRKDYRDAH